MNIAQNWRLNGQRYALKGVKCELCGTVAFPPRQICTCQSKQPQLFTFKQPETIALPDTYELRQAAR